VTVSLCAAVTLIDGFDTQAIAYVAPVLAKGWGYGAPAFGPVFASGLLGMMVGALGLGPVADRFGRRASIIISVGLMGIFALSTMAASDLQSLIVLRFLTGIGLGGAMPNAISLTAEYTPLRWRSTAVGVMFCGFPLGAVVGGLLAAKLIPAFGWTSIFLIGGLAPLVLVLVLLIWLPESVRHIAAHGGSSETIETLMRRANPDIQLAEHSAIRIDDVPTAAVSEKPISALFGNHRLAATLLLWVIFFMNLLMYYFLINWLPLVLQRAGLPLDQAILFTALLNAGGIIGTIILARVIDKSGSSRILTFALAGAAVMVSAVGYLGAQGGGWLAFAVFFAGFCVNGAQNNLNALAASLYPTSARATGVGFALGMGRVGSIVGPIVGGILLAADMELTQLFMIGAVPALVAAVAVWALTGVRHVAASTKTNVHVAH
jgi:AAHS family 4-hydroxybenzoate transporter-like MFS transporter